MVRPNLHCLSKEISSLDHVSYSDLSVMNDTPCTWFATAAFGQQNPICNSTLFPHTESTVWRVGVILQLNCWLTEMLVIGGVAAVWFGHQNVIVLFSWTIADLARTTPMWLRRAQKAYQNCKAVGLLSSNGAEQSLSVILWRLKCKHIFQLNVIDATIIENQLLDHIEDTVNRESPVTNVRRLVNAIGVPFLSRSFSRKFWISCRHSIWCRTFEALVGDLNALAKTEWQLRRSNILSISLRKIYAGRESTNSFTPSFLRCSFYCCCTRSWQNLHSQTDFHLLSPVFNVWLCQFVGKY